MERSASAWFHAPAYQAQLTPLADSVSPIVFVLAESIGGSGMLPAEPAPAGSASRASPPAAGAVPLGWNGGCVVLTA